MRNSNNRLRLASIFISLSIASLVLASSSFAITPESKPIADEKKAPCSRFDNVTLQLSLVPSGAPSPLTLEQIQNIIGPSAANTNTTITTYSWSSGGHVLVVTTKGDNITECVLTGSGNNSADARKIVAVYRKFKPATSIWSIKEIQNNLGAPYTKSNASKTYSWYCGIGSLTITTNQNGAILSATTVYQGSENSVAVRVGKNHAAWDDVTAPGQQLQQNVWRRNFTLTDTI